MVHLVYQLERAPTTGTLHYQGHLCLKSPTTINGARGLLPTGSHLEISRDVGAAISYCTKEDSRVSGPVEHGRRPVSGGSELVALARDLPREEFLDYCVAGKIPKGYYDEALRLCSDSSNTITEIESDVLLRVHSKLRCWGFPEKCEKAIIIRGPTGCGKTTWAKYYAPKPALFVTHIDDLRQLQPRHKSIIFDDMDFRHTPRTAQIHLVDRYDIRSIHVRYGTVSIPAGIVKIFTCNEYPFTEDDAIKRRVFYFNLDD